MSDMVRREKGDAQNPALYTFIYQTTDVCGVTAEAFTLCTASQEQ